jgi:hypothetical protein
MDRQIIASGKSQSRFKVNIDQSHESKQNLEVPYRSYLREVVGLRGIRKASYRYRSL